MVYPPVPKHERRQIFQNVILLLLAVAVSTAITTNFFSRINVVVVVNNWEVCAVITVAMYLVYSCVPDISGVELVLVYGD